MDKVKQWVLLISAVSIVSGVLISLLPKGKLKGAYKSLVGVVLVYAFLYPFLDIKSLDISIDEYLSNNYEVSENIDKYALSAMISSAEKAIEDIVKDELEKMNIKYGVKAECTLNESEIKLEALNFEGSLEEDEKELIINAMKKLGFDKGVISFTGEKDEE